MRRKIRRGLPVLIKNPNIWIVVRAVQVVADVARSARAGATRVATVARNLSLPGNLHRTLQFGRQIQGFALHPLSLRSSVAKTRDVELTFIQEMQHAEFPSCLRFSFTRNKLEKSRKPSSSACACLRHDWNGNRGNPCQS
jgi:hypothetical protein